MMRPDIVWFGESLDGDVLGEAMRLASEAQVCLVVGTSAVVYPAAGLADLTRRAGGNVIEVNVAETPLTGAATVSLRGPAATIVVSCRIGSTVDMFHSRGSTASMTAPMFSVPASAASIFG